MAELCNSDSDNPELQAWLAKLQPDAELTVRLALRRRFADVRANRCWSARIDALTDQLKPTEAKMARIRRDADGLIKRIDQEHERGITHPARKRAAL